MDPLNERQVCHFVVSSSELLRISGCRYSAVQEISGWRPGVVAPDAWVVEIQSVGGRASDSNALSRGWER